MAKKDSLEQFKKIQKKLLGQSSWQVKQGYGSFVLLEFSKKIKKTLRNGMEYFRGEYRIWIYCCSWVIIDKTHHTIAHCESSREEISAALNRIQNIALVTLERRLDSREIELGFANGLSFKLTPHEDAYEDAECMTISTPDGYVLAFGPQNDLNYYPSNQPYSK